MTKFEELMQSLKGKVPECTVKAAAEKLKASPNTVVIDVREEDSFQTAHIPGAISIPRGRMELEIEKKIADKSTPIICHCGGGTRSLLAAKTLREFGYADAVSMSGGFKAWKEAGLPVETPGAVAQAEGPALGAEEKKFYARHTQMPEVGTEGQLKLKKARVLIIGAGGLGSPAALYLAAAGIGTLGIADFDVVDISNLHRQILHNTRRLGQPKVDSARETLLALNPNIAVPTHKLKLEAQNAAEIFRDYDLIVDGSDNFPTRYLINDVCVQLEKPFVHGSIYRFEGQVSVFWPGRDSATDRSPCYRCLFPSPPPAELAPSCAEAGVLGILPGVIGCLQALEAVKFFLEKGDLLVGRLLCFDALKNQFRELTVKRDPNCSCCGR